MEQKYEQVSLYSFDSKEDKKTIEDLRKTLSPTDRFLSPWKYYDQWLVDREETLGLFLPDVRGLGNASSALTQEVNALIQSKKALIASFLEKGPFTPGIKPASSSEADLAQTARTLITREKSPSDEQTEAKVSILHAFYSIGTNRSRFMHFDALGKSIEASRVRAIAERRPLVIQSLALLAVHARHPSIAFLTQCAVDEIFSMQADAFLSPKKMTPEETLGRFVALYMFRVAHRVQAGTKTLLTAIPEIENRFARAILRWHLFDLPSLSDKPTDVLLGYSPVEQTVELPFLLNDDMVRFVYTPRILEAIDTELKESSSPLTVAQKLVHSMQIYCSRCLPQMSRAFPHLVSCTDRTSSLVYFPSTLTCKTSTPVSLNEDRLVPMAVLPSDPKLQSYNLQHKTFNRTHEGFIHRMFGLPAIIGLKGLVTTEVTLGPCLESGRYAVYRPFARIRGSTVELRTKDSGPLQQIALSGLSDPFASTYVLLERL